MAQNRPPRAPAHYTAKPGERYPNDRARIELARQAAEALFAPKPQTPEAAPTTPVRREVVTTPAPRASLPRAVADSQVARIRAWVKYGMSAAEVAKVCGVSVDEIERVLRKA
jgi:DNA-directed RNA polymerase specialized sigma24 family protein